MFVTYSGLHEVIVTTKKDEKQAIKLYFTEGGRSLDDYDRSEHREIAIDVSVNFKVS